MTKIWHCPIVCCEGTPIDTLQVQRTRYPPRVGAGRRSAVSSMGRKRKLTEAQKDEARHRRAEGATLAELARSYGVGKSTISRLTGLDSPDPLT